MLAVRGGELLSNCIVTVFAQARMHAGTAVGQARLLDKPSCRPLPLDQLDFFRQDFSSITGKRCRFGWSKYSMVCQQVRISWSSIRVLSRGNTVLPAGGLTFCHAAYNTGDSDQYPGWLSGSAGRTRIFFTVSRRMILPDKLPLHRGRSAAGAVGQAL